MSNEGFLSRWSRRKIETVEEAPSPIEAVSPEIIEETDAQVVVAEEPTIDQEAQEAIIADLPDIEELTPESDFSVFMQHGVPEELKKLALRKLWRTNPVFANLDGLNDYDEDFTKITPLAAGVADELMKMMKENSGNFEEPEEEVLEDEEEAVVTDEAPELEPVIDEDDDQNVGDAEDDF